MTGPISIRRLVPEDLAHYKTLRDDMLAAHPEAFSSDASEGLARAPESYRSRLGMERPDGGQFTLGAWDGAQLIGAIGCERDVRVKVRHIGHIIGMMVRDASQGRGIGRDLLAGCIDEARRAAGLEMLTLTVTAGNVPAIRLYERFGFIRYGSLPRAICVEGRYHAKDQMVLVL